jgi:hypothetical protein
VVLLRARAVVAVHAARQHRGCHHGSTARNASAARLAVVQGGALATTAAAGRLVLL